jgi:hypothetical protein
LGGDYLIGNFDEIQGVLAKRLNLATAVEFQEEKAFVGARKGMVFKKDVAGVGYYTDVPPMVEWDASAAPKTASGGLDLMAILTIVIAIYLGMRLGGVNIF